MWAQPSYGATSKLDAAGIYKLITPEFRHSCIIVSSCARLKANDPEYVTNHFQPLGNTRDPITVVARTRN